MSSDPYGADYVDETDYDAGPDDPGPAKCEHGKEHENCRILCETCGHDCSEHYPIGKSCDFEDTPCDCKQFKNAPD